MMKIIAIQIITIILLTKLCIYAIGAPAQRNQPEIWSLNLPDLQGQLGKTLNNPGYMNHRQSDDDDDDPSFRDAVATYGRNRWNNFRNSFVEFWDILRAGGRGIRSWFVSDND
ncbi:uncharacterized protein LOC107368695 [Tetranychus urticae]|uniref:Uncharacterized protein n=1 Tax=Tetranychus urticae TaxID=32264 RepID=T1KZG8_TETUR|nr:uncharacterized protein LOC107368695 [Tetranychus urticae]